MSVYSTGILADSPAGYWRFNETSGTSAADSSGNARTMTSKNGSGSATAPSAWSVSGALSGGGDSDTAVSLGGSVGFLSNSSTISLGDTFTLEVWVKRTHSGVKDWIVNHNAATSSGMWIDTDDKVHTGTNFSTTATSSVAITDTTAWHHIVYTKNGATAKIYVDGIDVTVTGSNATGSGSGALCWGNQSDSNFAPVSLDEAAYYATALSAARVSAHYTAATQVASSSVGGPDPSKTASAVTLLGL